MSTRMHSFLLWPFSQQKQILLDTLEEVEKLENNLGLLSNMSCYSYVILGVSYVIQDCPIHTFLPTFPGLPLSSSQLLHAPSSSLFICPFSTHSFILSLPFYVLCVFLYLVLRYQTLHLLFCTPVPVFLPLPIHHSCSSLC